MDQANAPTANTKKVRCVVVTPETTLLDQTVDFVAFPAVDGEVGVYSHRAPLVTRLGPGELRLQSGRETSFFYIDGGFCQIKENVVTILTARAIAGSGLVEATLDKQLADASAQIPTTDEGFTNKEKALERVRAGLRLVRKLAARR